MLPGETVFAPDKQGANILQGVQTRVLSDGALVVCDEPFGVKRQFPITGIVAITARSESPGQTPLFAGKSDSHKYKKKFVSKNRNVVTE